MIHHVNKCVNITKLFFVGDIYNNNIFSELTVSLLFALPVKLPVRVILYVRCALSGVGIRHLLPLENLKLESSGDVDSLGSAGPSSLPSGMEMRMPYDAYGRGDIVTASLQVRAVPLR